MISVQFGHLPEHGLIRYSSQIQGDVLVVGKAGFEPARLIRHMLLIYLHEYAKRATWEHQRSDWNYARCTSVVNGQLARQFRSGEDFEN